MSEKSPKPSQSNESADYRASLNATSTGELFNQVEDLAGDRFRLTSNDRLQMQAGTSEYETKKGKGDVRNVGGKFKKRHELEDIAAFEDQIRLGMKAKELSHVTPEIDAALDYAKEQVSEMNETESTTSTLKEVGVMRHALVKSKAISALEVGNMSDDDVSALVEYMRLDHYPAETSEPAPETESAQHEFAVGQTVKVLRSAGNIEDGWYIDEQLEGNEYVVARSTGNERLSKTVSEEMLKLWNDTSVSDTQPDDDIIDAEIVDDEDTAPIAPDAPAQDAILEGEVLSDDSTEDAESVLTPLDAPAQDAILEGEEDVQDTTDSRESRFAKFTPSYWIARMQTASFMRNERPANAPEQHRSRNIMIGFVGAMAVGVAGYLALRGHDTSGANDLVAAGANTKLPAVDIVTGAAEQAQSFSNEALTVSPGEGWIHQLQDMGFSSNEIPGVLKKLANSNDPAIREWVYTMKDGNPGLAKPGQMSANVLQSIQKLR